MQHWANRLRIGEKIGLGFGVVVLIFLAVVWHDQRTLRMILADYRALNEVFAARQSAAFLIESRLSAMRAAEERFLGTRDSGRVDEVRRQGAELAAQLQALGRLDAPSRQTAEALGRYLQAFLARFDDIVSAWRIRGLDEDSGLQGAFRDSAHALEARVIRAMPDLQVQVLQLRRREKDYLLRGRAEYVTMVEGIALVLREEIRSKGNGEPEQAALIGLVDDYERNFRALVAQDRRIAGLTVAMDEAAARITPLVKRNLDEARRTMGEMSERIARSSAAHARHDLWVAVAATLGGVLFAVLLTVRIVRPVREMAGLLDRLTYENPPERIPTTPDPRDEIMSMAISLNTLADYKSTFANWWRGAMREAVALREHQTAERAGERDETLAELRAAVDFRIGQIAGLRAELERQSESVLALTARIEPPHARLTAAEATALRHAAERMRGLLKVLGPPHAT